MISLMFNSVAVFDLATLELRSKVNTHAQMNFLMNGNTGKSITLGESKNSGLIVIVDNILNIDDEA